MRYQPAAQQLSSAAATGSTSTDVQNSMWGQLVQGMQQSYPFCKICRRRAHCCSVFDGQLTFFEQEALAFSRYLPEFLLPGPLAYVAASDSFITSSAALELLAYKYSVLAAANGEKQLEHQQGE
eukprot:GHRR01036101.1.p1 GENE.GHRR01036101.1~~GHRR01036101.1.p1  ORF type:complete len:124 (-),score=48.71 GHRR01036101.1:632-1003(-)